MNQQHSQLRSAECGVRSECAEGAYCSNPKSEFRIPKLPRPGLTLIEVVASTMIVGLMAVAALDALAAATKSSNSIGNRAVAAGLADELMSEIMMQSYSDPDGSPVFGHESGGATNIRSAFDDVEDYDGWNAKPRQHRDGTVMPDPADWRRRASVTYVSPTKPAQTSATDQGAKRIHVTIEYQNVVLADQYAVFTDNEDK